MNPCNQLQPIAPANQDLISDTVTNTPQSGNLSSAARAKQTRHVTIRDYLKEARKAVRITRQDLGQYWGVSRKTVLHYETGALRIPADIITDIFCAGIKSLMAERATPRF